MLLWTHRDFRQFLTRNIIVLLLRPAIIRGPPFLKPFIWVVFVHHNIWLTPFSFHDYFMQARFYYLFCPFHRQLGLLSYQSNLSWIVSQISLDR